MTAKKGPSDRMVLTRLTLTLAKEAYFNISLIRYAIDKGKTALNCCFDRSDSGCRFKSFVNIRP